MSIKKIVCIIACLGVLFYLYISNARPELSGFGEGITAYIGSASSSSKICDIEEAGIFLDKVKGESINVTSYKTAVEIIEKLGAEVIFIEKTENSVNYYCKTKKFKRSVIIFGEEINLHISVNEGKIKLGTPMIFGSF